MTLKNRAGRICVTVLFVPTYMQNTTQGLKSWSCTAWEENISIFSPKYSFQAVSLNHDRLLLARLTLIYLAVLTPRVQCSVRHIPSQIPSGSSSSFLPLPLIQRDFCWSDCSHSLGMIAPCQHRRKQTFTPRWLKLLHAFETAELTR